MDTELTEIEDMIRLLNLLNKYADLYGIDDFEDTQIHDVWVEVKSLCDSFGVK